MVLDGVEFPTVRFDTASAYITWEQINATIIVEDPSNAIVSDYFQVIYKNSIDIYVSQTIKANTSTGNIPININGLRANETYTFQTVCHTVLFSSLYKRLSLCQRNKL